MRKALSVGRKEVRQILRDRRTLLILLFVPAFFLLLYGYALNWDIRHVRLAVDDRDRSVGEPGARLGVRQLRLLRSRRRHPKPASRSPTLMDRGDVARRAGHSRPGSVARPRAPAARVAGAGAA